jgi:type IV pilus assembly protein PilC
MILFGVLVLYTTVPGKRIIDGGLLALPVIGGVIRSANLAQASQTLAMQLKSGIALRDSLAVTAKVLGNRALAEVFERAAERILGGQSLADALSVRRVPPLVRHMAAIGETSGELEGTLGALGAFYRKDLNVRVKTLAAWVEPALILFVGGLVGTVYLAFFQAALKVSTG